MNENERILNKIKRCLALSKSSNEHEAATALRQAHMMMEKYSITLDDVQLSTVNESNSDTNLGVRYNRYKTQLANLIAKKFSCKVYLQGNWDDDKNRPYRKICFVGVDIYPEIASYAYDVLIKQLEKSRRQYIRDYLGRVRIAENKYQRADAFCYGWIDTVAKLIDNLVPPTVDKLLIENKMQTLQLTPSKKSIDRVKKLDGKLSMDYMIGQMEGENAQLHNAMNGTDKYARIEVSA